MWNKLTSETSISKNNFILWHGGEKKKKIIRFSCSQIKRTKIEIKTRFPFETEENLIVEILYTVAKNSVQLDNAVYTYEQCTTTGPSCRRLFISAIT